MEADSAIHRLKYTPNAGAFFCANGFLLGPSFVQRPACHTSASVQAHGSHLFFNGNSRTVYGVPVYCVLKSLYVVQDGDDVRGFWIGYRQIHEKLLFFNHVYK